MPWSEQVVPWGLTGKLLSDHHLRLPSTCFWGRRRWLRNITDQSHLCPCSPSCVGPATEGYRDHRGDPSKVCQSSTLCHTLRLGASTSYTMRHFFLTTTLRLMNHFTARKNEVTKILRNLPKITQLVSSRNTDLNLGLSHSKLHLAVCFLNQLDHGDSCTTLWIH